MLKIYPTWMNKESKPFLMSPSKTLQRLESKNVGEKGRKGIIISHVLSMRPYAHILSNHAKNEHFIETCYFSFRKSNAYSRRPYQSIRHIN